MAVCPLFLLAPFESGLMQPWDYYHQAKIADAIVAFSSDREFAGRTIDGAYGTRPNVIQYRNDFFQMTENFYSFHASIERWNNPLLLEAGARLDEIRKGWDLVLDLDGNHFEIMKKCAGIMIEALQAHGVNSISIKFSGNKGFHIGIPFEAFPSKVDNLPTKRLFPELPKKIALYLKDFVEEEFRQELTGMMSAKEFAELVGKPVEEVSKDGRIDPWASANIDTILVSPRHMIRVPYSLHEKSGLASLPIEINKIKSFKKEDATPEKVKTDIEFLSRDAKPNEMTEILSLALSRSKGERKREGSERRIERPTTKLPPECFPPCIKNILSGVQDGRKRSEFILRCFLNRVGYNWGEIQEMILEWNKKNPTPLKENYLISQITWHKKQEKGIMPPNCENEAYYKDFRVCDPVKLCSKNPVVTALRMARESKDRSKKAGGSR